MDNNDVNLTKLEELGELSDDEQSDRLHLERKVEQAFWQAGRSLAEIRDRRLFRSTHQTFGEYCRERFCFTEVAASYKIAAAKVVDNLTIGLSKDETKNLTNGLENESEGMTTIDVQILPTSERQVRPLTKLEPSQQREAWLKSVQQAGGRVPSGRIVKGIVEQMQERKKVENPWRVGEVAKIVAKDDPQLRGKGGCFAVITGVGDFSCTVKVWDGEYQVKPENLKDLCYSDTQQDEVKSLCDRLSKIKVDDGEKPMKDFLAGLGKIQRRMPLSYEWNPCPVSLLGIRNWGLGMGAESRQGNKSASQLNEYYPNP